MKQRLIFFFLFTAILVSASSTIDLISRSVDDRSGLIYERSSSKHVLPRSEEHNSFFADPAYLYRRDSGSYAGILQSRGNPNQDSSSGARQRSGAGPANQSHRQAAGPSSQGHDPAAGSSRSRSQSPIRGTGAAMSGQGQSQEASPPGNGGPNVSPSRPDQGRVANSPRGRSLSQATRRASTVRRPDEARVRVDSHDSGSYIKALPWYLEDGGHDPAWGRSGSAQKIASAGHVTGMTMHLNDKHRSTMDVTGKKVTGKVIAFPGGSAVLKSTGAGGTNTKIISHGIQDSATISAEAGTSGNPASISIQQTGGGGGTVLGTNSAHDQLPEL